MLSRPLVGLARCLSFAGVSLGLLLATEGQSFADDANCPPGSWFCGDQAQPQPAAPTAPAPAAEPAPAPPASATPAAAGTPPPPVIIYQAPPTAEPPPPYVYTPKDPPLRRSFAIGANLQLPLYVKRNGGDGGAMGGVGGLLRIRPRGGVFALQGEVGSYFGSDYNNDRRAEFAMAGNVMLFVMPKKRTSLYFLGGLGFAAAHVNRGVNERAYDYSGYYGRNAQPSSSDFAYFGAQTGIGLEVGLGQRVALDFELRGFLRQRIDSAPEPEFISDRGQVSNASAGGLFSMGLTFYF